MSTLPHSFSIGGFRSFGERQRISGLTKINLFIGRNNCGKSNVLRAISEVIPRYSGESEFRLAPLESHLRVDGSESPFQLGFAVQVPNLDDDWGILEQTKNRLGENLWYSLREILVHRAAQSDDNLLWFDYQGAAREFVREPWEEAVYSSLNAATIEEIWSGLTGYSGGNLAAHWVPQIVENLKRPFSFTSRKIVMIPAIRQIGGKSSVGNDFGGDGIIERLARLQNPDVHNRSDRDKFERINSFLRYVTENDSATIEVPHDRETINVQLDGLFLPLESMGTGIHEVVILATASTILEHSLICMEEPELHLNPVLQRKLAQYLHSETSNQYFIATHSAALMDAENMSIFHVRHEDGQSVVSKGVTPSSRSKICDDLGYKPSDILQSNCIVWVEGPSDRIYLNYWIKSAARELVEGVDYSIMFYGGRLASHVSGLDPTEIVDEFISLRRLNRKSAILIDSDKRTPQTHLNQTKTRLITEFNAGPGFAWVTAGREIENYIPDQILRNAILEVAPRAAVLSDFTRYSDSLEIRLPNSNIAKAPKVAVAKRVTMVPSLNLDVLDLSDKLHKLIGFIRESNR